MMLILCKISIYITVMVNIVNILSAYYQGYFLTSRNFKLPEAALERQL